MSKEAAFAAPTRLLVAGLIGLLAAVGVLFFVAGLVAVIDGRDGSWFPALLGLQLTVLGLLGATSMLPSRRSPEAVAEVDEGVALPLRPGYAARQALLSVTLGSLLLPVALQDDNALMVVVGSVTLTVGLAVAAWLFFSGAHHFRIRLTPAGLMLPSGWGTVRRLPWSEIKGAQAVPRWQPLLVVLPKDDRAEIGMVKLLGQGWGPEALTAVIEHYVENPAQRPDLTSASAVQRRSGQEQ